MRETITKKYIKFKLVLKTFRIRDIKYLSTDADNSTDTKKNLLRSS